MLNPKDPVHINRLCRTIDNSRKQLEPFRRNRLEILREYVGLHYSDSGAADKVPVNLIQLASNIYLRHLVARAPLALITSNQAEVKPLAANMQAWMDKATTGMKLDEHIRMTVLNALFCIGVMKVGVATAGTIEMMGTTHYIDQPFAESVDLDDLVIDMQAKRFDQVQFVGNRYRASLEEMKQNDLYDEEERMKLSPMTRYGMNERGDDRVSSLSQGTEMPWDTFEDHVELYDVWLPREHLVLTLPYWEDSGQTTSKPLRIVEWKGPYCGPYHLLSYVDVPNNIMPAAPLQSLIDLHNLANRVFRKLGRQADRQKSVLGYMGGSAPDAERITKTDDGETVRMDNPDRAREYKFGGVDQMGLLAFQTTKDLYYNVAGNLDSLGGLSPQSGTLGQDKMLQQSASAQVAEMQDRTRAMIKEVYHSLAYWWYTNPVLTYSATRQVEGLDIPVVIPPEQRTKRFEDMDVDIDPYSMSESTPQTKLASLLQLVQTIILPVAPLLAQTGLVLKWTELFRIIGQYANLPELAEILQQGPPPDVAQAQALGQEAANEPPGMPAATTRTNVRVNRPGMTNRGQSQVMQQLLAGGGQPKQAGMVGRPVS